jgi:hypothetical protein
MRAQYDGANCCNLDEGHEGEHVNAFGNKTGPWGTQAEFEAIAATWYVDPRPVKKDGSR